MHYYTLHTHSEFDEIGSRQSGRHLNACAKDLVAMLAVFVTAAKRAVFETPSTTPQSRLANGLVWRRPCPDPVRLCRLFQGVLCLSPQRHSSRQLQPGR